MIRSRYICHEERDDERDTLDIKDNTVNDTLEMYKDVLKDITLQGVNVKNTGRYFFIL